MIIGLWNNSHNYKMTHSVVLFLLKTMFLLLSRLRPAMLWMWSGRRCDVTQRHCRAAKKQTQLCFMVLLSSQLENVNIVCSLILQSKTQPHSSSKNIPNPVTRLSSSFLSCDTRVSYVHIYIIHFIHGKVKRQVTNPISVFTTCKQLDNRLDN